MTSVVKGIVGPAKVILRGIRKSFKSITGSKFGRALLIGAAIFTAGVYLGYWGGPSWMPTMSPAAAEAGVATGTAASEAGTSIAAAEGSVATGTGAAETLGAGTAIEPASAAAQEMAASSTLLGGAPATSGVYAPAAEAAKGGFIKNWWGGLSDPVKLGFTVSGMQTAGNMLASAFSPDALDVAERQAELERENLRWRNEFLYGPNFNVGQFSLGMSPSGQALTDSSGRPIYPTPPTTPGVHPVQPVQPIQPRGFIAQAMGR